MKGKPIEQRPRLYDDTQKRGFASLQKNTSSEHGKIKREKGLFILYLVLFANVVQELSCCSSLELLGG